MMKGWYSLKLVIEVDFNDKSFIFGFVYLKLCKMNNVYWVNIESLVILCLFILFWFLLRVIGLIFCCVIVIIFLMRIG